MLNTKSNLKAVQKLSSVNQEQDARKARARQFWIAFFARKPVIAAFAIVVIMVLVALLAPLISPCNPYNQDLTNIVTGPSSAHLLGTDGLGRDTLSRIIYGTQVSLSVGFVSTAIAGSIGIILGLISGYVGGWVDNVIMRVMDAMMSIPLVIMALFLGSVLGKGLGNVMLSIGIVMIPGYARLTRGQVMSVKQLDFITAAKIGGATKFTNTVKHIFPNSISPNIVLATSNFGSAILIEASLSFLGMGINPPTASWGAMVSDGYKYLNRDPVLAIVPGLFIMATVWAFNIVGDALRDALDPRLRGA